MLDAFAHPEYSEVLRTPGGGWLKPVPIVSHFQPRRLRPRVEFDGDMARPAMRQRIPDRLARHEQKIPVRLLNPQTSWNRGLGSGGTENRLKESLELDIVVPGGGVPERAQLPLSHSFRERERIPALEIDVVKDDRRQPRDVFVLQRITRSIARLFLVCGWEGCRREKA
jgi:hypothetical protein